MYATSVEQIMKVPVKRLFSAWAKAEELSIWFTTNAKQDFKVGGRYSNDDKDEGTFLEIIPDEKIRFTWENKLHCPNTEVLMIFEDINNSTSKITITHYKLESEEHKEGMHEGWRWSVYSLKSYLETGKPVTYNEWEILTQN